MIYADELYACKDCDTVVARQRESCPACGKSDDGEVERYGIGNARKVTYEKPWYQTIRFDP